jgi:hypothetical protein
MHAFEELVAALLQRSGYWVSASVKVELTKQEKNEIGRPSSPRWELDLVGYHAAKNEVLILECKSYLDSTGVSLSDLSNPNARYATRYKLFTEPDLYRVVAARLVSQFLERGACLPNPTVRLGLAVGRLAANTTSADLKSFFDSRGWMLWDPNLIVSGIRKLADDGYDNSTASMVAKLLLRPGALSNGDATT